MWMTEFTLYPLNLLFGGGFLALTYYFLMSYLSARFFLEFMIVLFKSQSCFLRRIVGLPVISNRPSFLGIRSSLMSEFLQYFRDRVSIRVTGQY